MRPAEVGSFDDLRAEGRDRRRIPAWTRPGHVAHRRMPRASDRGRRTRICAPIAPLGPSSPRSPHQDPVGHPAVDRLHPRPPGQLEIRARLAGLDEPVPGLRVAGGHDLERASEQVDHDLDNRLQLRDRNTTERDAAIGKAEDGGRGADDQDERCEHRRIRFDRASDQPGGPEGERRGDDRPDRPPVLPPCPRPLRRTSPDPPAQGSPKRTSASIQAASAIARAIPLSPSGPTSATARVVFMTTAATAASTGVSVSWRA